MQPRDADIFRLVAFAAVLILVVIATPIFCSYLRVEESMKKSHINYLLAKSCRRPWRYSGNYS